jgi:hypothetical protein
MNPSNVFNIENLVLRATSEFNGFAGKHVQPFQGTGVLESMKSQTPNTKLQGVRCRGSGVRCQEKET